MSCEDIIIEVETEPIEIEMTPEGKDGKSLNPRGDWNSSAVYAYRDMVAYQGNSYIALKNVPAGTLPTDTEYWMINAAGGNTTYWGNIHGTLSNQTDLVTALASKADANAVYTKTEADALLSGKADADSVYTKAEADALLDAKADADSVYTKTEADALLDEKADASSVYTKTATDDLLDLKANKADVYTQQELDGIFDGIDNALDSKADADSVYTKSQTNTLLAAKANAADLGTMAGVNDAPSDGKEYARKNGQWAEVVGGSGSTAWGEITGDLDDQTDLKNALDAKANTADLGALADQDTVDYETEVTNKPTLGTMSTESASDYYDKDEVNDLINNSGVVAELDASGSIATFETNLAENLSRLSVSIDPVQDLHGYDAPWPAGGGKNLLDVSNGTGAEMRGVTPSYDGAGGLTFSGIANDSGFGGNWTLTGGLTLPAGTYTISIGQSIGYRLDLLSGWSSKAHINASNTSNTFTLSEETTIDKITITVTSGETVSVNVKKIQIESGSTATSYAPYSNVCPISGYSSATVTRTGKNFINFTDSSETVSQVSAVSSDGVVTCNGTASGEGAQFVKKASVVLPVGTYIVNGCPSGGSSSTYNIRIGKGGDPGSYVNTDAGNGVTLNVTESDTYTLSIAITAGYNAQNLVFKPMIRLASDTDSTFAPYSGTSVTIALGDTYYGAQLDAVAGTLTVDKAIFTFNGSDAEGWQLSNSGNRVESSYLSPQRKANLSSDGLTGAISNAFQEITPGQTWLASKVGFSINNNNANVAVSQFIGGGMTVENWKTYLQSNPLTIVAYLTSPTTVSLTPAQISLLLGENNVWSDTGDVSLSYFNNNTAEAITDVKQMIASTETSMTATRNYTSGSLIIVGPALMKATSNISSGASLVLGTNCVRTTLEEWILSLIA